MLKGQISIFEYLEEMQVEEIIISYDNFNDFNSGNEFTLVGFHHVEINGLFLLCDNILIERDSNLVFVTFKNLGSSIGNFTFLFLSKGLIIKKFSYSDCISLQVKEVI